MPLRRSRAALSRYDATILNTPGLRAYWPFSAEFGARDAFGSSHGVLVNSPKHTDGPDGAGGGALKLVGASTQYLTVADNNALDVADVFTLEVWFNRASIGLKQLLGKDGGGYGLLFGNDNTLRVWPEGSGSIFDTISTSTAFTTTSRWYHCMFTKNGATRAAYLDGVVNQSLGTNATLPDTANTLYIGVKDAGLSNPFDGAIARFALYNRPLGLADAKLHNAIGRGA